MNERKLRSIIIIAFLGLMSFMYPTQKITIWMIGDSTMSIKQTKAYPETGWGMPFAYFWDSSVVIENLAKNGRSSKSFVAEGLWKPVMEKIKEGDYVFIEFGHNDESIDKGDRYSAPEEFKANLTRYIVETRSKKGIPVLLTPVARRRFDANGKITETHRGYSELTREVAKEQQVPLIDMDRKSQALLQAMGTEQSKLLFNYLDPGEHPNYPTGREDDTHFNELGARKMAELALEGIKELRLEITARLVNNKP